MCRDNGSSDSAVQIHGQAALGGKLAEQRYRAAAFGHAALEVWDASDHVDAKIEGRLERGAGVGVAQIAFLGERHQL
jgi:hypothetical protein